MIKIYKGNIIYTGAPRSFTTIDNGYIVVENGKVKEVCSELPKEYKDCEIIDYMDNLIIPGFVDLHFHAPQFANIGLGLDKELLLWLDEYTFPEEEKYSDTNYATKVYQNVAKELIKQGTTRVVAFSTIHKNGTEILIDILNNMGIGAYVGKVNMDRNSPDFLIEDTNKSLIETEEILKEYADKYRLLKPIITPRFVPTCTPEIMSGLAKLAKKYNVPIQTHISENLDEIDWVKSLHPESRDYASVYKNHGLLGDRTILAHCVHNTDDEINMIKDNECYVAHCPNANYNLSSGIMPTRRFLDAGIKVGLGTDVGAGHTVSIAKVILSAIQASKINWLETKKQDNPLSLSEAFYLGTKGGGSFFGNVGSFEPGYDFDALIINDKSFNNLKDMTTEERLQKFIYVGDDRNIDHIYICGDKIDK